VRRLIQFAEKLYPGWWRNRYGGEFNALLEDAKPGWRDVLDILKGAIEMQMSIWTRAGLAAACGVVGATLALGSSFLMQPKYESSAILVLAGPDVQQLDMKQMDSGAGLAGIIEARGLYQRERTRQSMDAAVDKMKRSIAIHPIGSQVVQISFSYEDAGLAQTAIMDFAKLFFSKFPVKELEFPRLSVHALSPARANMAIFGLAGGLLVSLVLLVILPAAPPVPVRMD
jgi:hypothetical protein